MTDELKYKKLFNFLGRWVMLNENGYTVGAYLKERGINNVSIYGLGLLGRHLLYELKLAGINVEYGIDKRSDSLNLDIRFIDWKKEELILRTDLLIITAIIDYTELEKEICQVYEYPVISLEEIIVAMEEQRSKSEA